MSLRETVNSFGKDISGRYKPDGYCTFAPAEETEGFIDTSAELDGSRGIAFLCDRIRVDFDGIILQLDYAAIVETQIIQSYESEYADELVIKSAGTEIRVADYSLNKSFLKFLVDTLCLRFKQLTEEQREQERAECTARAAEHFAAQEKTDKPNVPVTAGAATNIFSEETKFAAPKDHTPVEITEEKIEWISGKKRIKPSDWNTAQNSGNAESSSNMGKTSESEEDLQDMSHEQTMSYLLSSISEINAPSDANAAKGAEKEQNENISEVNTEQPYISPEIPVIPEGAYIQLNDIAAPTEAAETAPVLQDKPTVPEYSFTIEPPSEDIYIKASRKLREICESGRLTRGQIVTALRENLLTAANAFMEVTENGAAVPEAIAPKIAELKAASDNLNSYFALGEDIAERVMFFMMYQMLSYADRIVEAPETKERLNDFFRRYGPSGIMLSMLDMRVQ